MCHLSCTLNQLRHKIEKYHCFWQDSVLQIGRLCDGIRSFQAINAHCHVTDDVLFSEGSVVADYVLVITLPESSESQVNRASNARIMSITCKQRDDFQNHVNVR